MSVANPRAVIRRTGSTLLVAGLVTVVGLPFATGASAAPVDTVNGCPCSLFSATDVPTVVDDTEGRAVELGISFRSDVSESVTAIRFYKSSANTGPHVGSLWTTSGELLARATFADESDSGWQTVTLSQPVVIAANTLYVASYHTTVGHFSYTPQYFSYPGHDRGILHAPGGYPLNTNGLFKYSAEPTFPTGTFNDNNYWIDIVAQPTVTSLTIAPPAATIIKTAGQQLTATAMYSDGNARDAAGDITWSSSNPAVASVSASGFVTGTGAGTAIITATAGSVASSSTVTVLGVNSVTIGGLPGSVAKGKTVQLTATAQLSDGTTLDVTNRATWSTSNGNATVNPSGLLTGTATGTVTVSATFAGVTKTGTLTVGPATVVSVSVTGTTSLRLLGASQLKATALYTDGTKVDVTSSSTWTSGNSFLVTVSNPVWFFGWVGGGKVQASLWLGSTTVSATFNGVKGSTTVTVS